MMKQKMMTNFEIKKTVPEIVSGFSEAAEAKGLHLTHTNIRMFVKLVEYAAAEAEICTVSSETVTFTFTTRDFAAFCEKTDSKVANRMINDSLHLFNRYGLIKYETAKYQKSIVTLYKAFFE